MYQEFMENYKKYEDKPKIREGYSSPIGKMQKSYFETEIAQEIAEEDKDLLQPPTGSSVRSFTKQRTFIDQPKKKQLLFEN